MSYFTAHNSINSTISRNQPFDIEIIYYEPKPLNDKETNQSINSYAAIELNQ